MYLATRTGLGSAASAAQQPLPYHCSKCGRALLNAELLSRYFRKRSKGGEIALLPSDIAEAAAMDAGWGVCGASGPVCPACLPEVTCPIMNAILQGLNEGAH